ncbi:MAG TPA: hypothetical protein VGM88_33490 [Kofleriaceae bacterium]|jgi:hypothetical protein
MSARLLLIGLVLAAACEKPSHDNIDKWTHTKKGPDKLKEAIANTDLDPDLSAHAAANLIGPKVGKEQEAYPILEHLDPARRSAVVAKLVPRLWALARVDRDDMLPDMPQVLGKDALIKVRPWADDATRQQIDAYLIDWYCVRSYQKRALVGGTLGSAALRMIGPPAAKKLEQVANGFIAAPGQGTTKQLLDSELLLGLAATGDPDAVKYVLDLSKMDRGDQTLPARAWRALAQAYVDPGGLFPVVPPAALVPNLDEIASFITETQDPEVINKAVSLVRMVGSPKCISVFVDKEKEPHADARFLYVVANAALKCGGPSAIGDVVRALPEGRYEHEALTGSISGEIAQMAPEALAVTNTRPLLDEKSTIRRWVAIEALGAMKSKEDAPKIASLAGVRDKLTGYWGGGGGKPDPTLGQRAKEVSDALSK